jgi:integrase
VVQERLGHSQISLTLDTYFHVSPLMQEEAAEKLDQLLTPISISLGQSNETISNE